MFHLLHTVLVTQIYNVWNMELLVKRFVVYNVCVTVGPSLAANLKAPVPIRNQHSKITVRFFSRVANSACIPGVNYTSSLRIVLVTVHVGLPFVYTDEPNLN